MKPIEIIEFIAAAIAVYLLAQKSGMVSNGGMTYVATRAATPSGNVFDPTGMNSNGPSSSTYSWDPLNARPLWVPADPIYSPVQQNNGTILYNNGGGVSV